MSERLRATMDEAVKDEMLRRGRLAEHVLALALAAGALSVEIRWPDPIEVRVRHEVPRMSRRKRRQLWKLAMVELDAAKGER